MINSRILVIVILFIGGFTIIGADNIFAQDGSGTGMIGNSVQTYEDPNSGISFEHPSHWTVNKTYGSVAVNSKDNNEAIQQLDDITPDNQAGGAGGQFGGGCGGQQDEDIPNENAALDCHGPAFD